MIGNLWFAILAFILGAGLTYLRMAGSATRQVAKPVPHRLVMGGIIPGLVDPPVDALPLEVGPEWKIRVGAATPEPLVAPEPVAGEATLDAAATTPDADEAEPIAEVIGGVETVEPIGAATPAEVEPPQTAGPGPAARGAVAETAPEAAAAAERIGEATEPATATLEPAMADEPKIAAGSTSEPSTSSWWAAAFDRGDPGPYPGPLRYASAWPPEGSRVLDVDDEFAAALGAGAAASAESAALFGATHRYAAEPEPVRPARDGRSQITAATPPTTDEPAAEELHEAQAELVGSETASAELDSAPAEELIKGNRDSMLYHTPDSPWYARTKAEEWFHTEQEAQAAGFERWNSRINARQD